MKINTLNSVNFAKKPVALCQIKEKKNNFNKPATLYELDSSDINDVEELKNSYCARAIYNDFKNEYFKNDYNSNAKYYALQDGLNNEFIAVAKTSKHLKKTNNGYKTYNAIDELVLNNKYNDSLTPMISYIAYSSKGCNEILTSFRTQDMPELKHSVFSKTDDNIWQIPLKRFDVAIDMAEKRNNMLFLED